MSRRLTAIIQREGDGFVALCPELDVASQGDTIETARENLREAVELFFECASPGEIQEVTIHTATSSPILDAYGIMGWTGDAATLERLALDPDFDSQEDA